MKNIYSYATPTGLIYIADNGLQSDTDMAAVTEISFKLPYTVSYDASVRRGYNEYESSVIKQTYDELCQYFNGKRHSFTVPLSPEGTTFQRSVWDVLLTIPYGKTLCYSEIAQRIGKPSAARAVGNAVGKNPICIILPCHRVIAKDNGIGGFSGGLDIKRLLLNLEGIKVRG